MLMEFNHCNRHVPVVESTVSMVYRLLSDESMSAAFIHCVGANVDFVKVLAKSHRRRLECHVHSI